MWAMVASKNKVYVKNKTNYDNHKNSDHEMQMKHIAKNSQAPEVGKNENGDYEADERQPQSNKLEFSGILGHFLGNLKRAIK